MNRLQRSIQAGAIFAEPLDDLNYLRNRYTVSGTPIVANSPYGHALYFNGSTDYIFITGYNGYNLNGEATVLCRFKPDDYTTTQKLFLKGSGATQEFCLEFGRTDNKFSAIWGNVVVAYGSSIIGASTWRDVALVRSGSSGAWTATFYLDGAPDGSTAAIATDPNGISNMFVAASDAGANLFNGRLRDMILFPRALSATEISNFHYNKFF